MHLGSESDPRKLLENFCHSAREIIGARLAMLALADAGSLLPVRVLTSGMREEAARAFADPDPSHPLIESVLSERRCVRLLDPDGLQSVPGAAAAAPHVSAWMGVPIASPSKVFGWFGLMDSLGGAGFSEDDERLAGILGAQLGRIYETGTIYADMKLHAAALEIEVSERKRAEAALRATENRLQRVLAASPAVLYALAEDGDDFTPHWISPNLPDIVGWRIEDVTEPEWWENRIHPDDREVTLAKFHTEIVEKRRLSMEYRFRHRDGGYRWIQDELRLVRGTSGEPPEIIGSWMDITEKKRIESQFHQSQKMEAVGLLAGGVAHDFNNLLTIVEFSCEELMSQFGDSDPLQETIAQIQEAGRRGASLTRQLLAYSRQTVLEPKILNLNDVVAEHGKMLGRLIGEDIDVQAFLDPALKRIRVDPGHIGQVIMNLAVNARDAMPQGGKLTIETANVYLDEAYADAHHGTKPGAYVQLSMADTGVGMSPQVQSRIFDPFFTTKESGVGTGLGLATVYGIVQQSGGSIYVYSEKGRGAVFKLYFPATESLAPDESRPVIEPTLPRGETVLLVEDEDALRKPIRRIIERDGYTVLEAGRAADAIDLCMQHGDVIKLLVSDVVMPEMAGPKLAEHLKNIVPGLKVLFVSGYTDDAVFRHGILNPGAAFLQKPFSAQALTNKMRQVLDTEEAG
jgi:PAS domain S-box-containing protein